MAEAHRKALRNLEEITDEEDAAITADAQGDPDNPPADDLLRRRGRPPLEKAKQPVKLRLDPDVIERFKADGPGWQSRMNAALRKAAGL
ncbi:BrnA antitoxin family protein [Chelativorans sp.]|uniref:BrnA antitoxin family protein n=1 Tax=Chelativorans sp. TaxID=2203393 RepID=UPI00281267C1|nr:BrnA antitoxin family protein [Chelativorans sp.]